MPLDWDPQDRHPEWGTPRYYKPRDPSAALIHVQWTDYWENYSLDGRLVADGQGDFPADILASFEEIHETQAMQLMEEGETSLAAEARANPQASLETHQKTPGSQGIGGWLVLPIIGLLLSLIFSLVWMFTDGVSALQPDVWPRVPVSGRSLITFEVFANLVGIVAPIGLLVMLFMKRRALPKLMVGFYVFMLLTVIVDSIGILVIGPDLIPDPSLRAEAGWSIGMVVADIGRNVVVCAIWIPYFLTSRRVKNTFVRPQPARASLSGTASTITSPYPLDGESMATSPSQEAVARKTRVRRLWLTGASLVVLLGVIGVLIWNCADPGTPPPASASGNETYVDAEHGYSFDYPSAWVASHESVYPNDTSDSVVNVYDPFGAGDGTYSFTFAEIGLYVMAQSVDATLFEDLRAGFDETMASNEKYVPSFVLVEAVTQTTFGGIEALRTTYTVEIDGIEVTATEYLVPFESALFSVIFQAASQEWEMNQDVFESIADTFKPGS